ncbi:MAG: hypothetical protein P8X86_17595 [Desulfofustis sp.]
MNYWWVNQNQTHEQEIEGGFMWSPKKKRNGGNNEFYNNMARVAPGDIVFSFFGSEIPYLGIIKSPGFSQDRPETFDRVGETWEVDGWMVNVDYRRVANVIKPKDHMNQLAPLLPEKHSPLGTDKLTYFRWESGNHGQ